MNTFECCFSTEVYQFPEPKILNVELYLSTHNGDF